MLGLRTVLRRRDWGWLLLLAVLPNLLSVLNVEVGELTIHTFQLGIFIAARRYGIWGGLSSGIIGSLYSAVVKSNPYLILGNAILGVACGALLARGWSLIGAVLVAFLLQLIWLWPSDVWLQGMPAKLVNEIIISLLLTNLMWSGLLQLVLSWWKRRR